MNRIAELAAALLVTALLVFPFAAHSETKGDSLQAFFGTWVGRSATVVGEGLADRDYKITIAPYDKDGFTLNWTAVIRYTGKKTKVRSESINFRPYRPRPGLYFSAVKRDSFGHMVTANPISGDPYVWASLQGKALLVTALYIDADGSYEVQTFRRTLAGSRMSSHFESVRDGKQLREITGKLERVAQ